MDEAPKEPNGEDVNILELLRTFWIRKWDILFITNCFVIVTLVYLFWFAEPVYEAQATIMPLKSSSAAGAFSALRDIVPTGLAPFPLSQGEEDLNRFMNILQSRTMAGTIVSDLDLIHLLHADKSPEKRPGFQKMADAVKRTHINASDNKTGLVQVTGIANQSHLAADIANAYVQNLHLYLKKNTTTESRRNRLFIEEQYRKAQQDLKRAESELQAFQEEHKLFSITAQTDQLITQLGTLKANLVAKEIALNVLGESRVSKTSMQYKTLEFEIEELKRVIAEIEKGSQDTAPSGAVALDELPALQRRFAQLMRERAMQETLHGLLASQLKQAEITEESDKISFLTLDPAIPPLLRIKPNRKSIALLGVMLGFIFAFAYVTSRVLWERYSEWQQNQTKA